MLDHIRVDPRVWDGRPTMRWRRVTVEFVLRRLGDGYPAADLVRECPEVGREASG